MNAEIMLGIQSGPTLNYADEYAAVNKRINELSTALAAEARNQGFQSEALPASVRTDKVNITGHNCGICAAVCPYGLKRLK
jgi:ferredoxin